MFASVSDYGPFPPVVGYAGAIMVAGAALFMLWGGKMEKWRPPDEDLPGTAQALVLLLCGVGMVLQWYFATPAAIASFLAAVAALAVASMVCFLATAACSARTFILRRPDATADVRILGGRDLRPEAEAPLWKEGVDIRTLLEGAAYKLDLLWTRESRQWVEQRVLDLHPYARSRHIRADRSELRHPGAHEESSSERRPRV